jgi:hypothetical protein
VEWRSIQFGEAHGSPVEQLADDQARVVRELLCDWDDRAPLAANLVGWPTLVTAGGVTYISRVTPHGYTGLTKADGTPFLYATAVNRIAGEGSSSVTASGENTRYNADGGGVVDVQGDTCRLLVEYRSPLYDIVEDTDCIGTAPSPLAGYPDEGTLLRYVERYLEPAYRADRIPRGLFKTVEASPRVVLESLNKVHAAATLVYVHKMRPDVPYLAILNTTGRINSTAFDNGRFPAGVLYCQPPRMRTYMSALGQRLYDFRFAFSLAYNVDASGTAQGWNGPYVQRNDAANKLDYTLLTTTGLSGGQKLYPAADFTKLFQPDQ